MSRLHLACLIVVGFVFSLVVAKDFTNSWAIALEKGVSPQTFAEEHGFASFMKLPTLENTFLFRKELIQIKRSSISTNEYREWEEINARLASNPQVKFSLHQEVLTRRKRSLVFVDPMWNSQWNLNGSNAVNLNVVPAWERNVNGEGVLVAIVDDGMQANHPDLVQQFSRNASWNVVDDNGDVSPGPYDQDGHGTKCGGTATARNNTICGVGVAYRANVAAVKVIDSRRGSTDAEEAAALGHRLDLISIYSASWGPSDDAQRLEGPGSLLMQVMENAIRAGRGGLGTIYVWANGNGGSARDNCNYDGYANSRFTISVQGVTQAGTKPHYTEECAATLVSAPGGLNRGFDDIVAPTLNSDCTSGFAETSACAPQAAGVVAMMLQVNPLLNWREVQDILLRTAQKNDPSSTTWLRNAAGRFVSHQYGYGLMDANAATLLADNYDTVRHRLPYLQVGKESEVGHVIGAQKPYTATITLPDLAVEHVVVRLWVRTETRGDLGITLTSPMGTPSELATRHTNAFANGQPNYEGWNFTSVRHWDELAEGDWKLTITDFGGTGASTFEKWALYVYGTDPTLDTSNDTFPPRPTATSSPPSELLSRQRLILVAIVTGIVILVVILTVIYLGMLLRRGPREDHSSLPLDTDWDADERGEDSSHALQRVLGTGPTFELEEEKDTQGLLNNDNL